jgi:hypothetical protein
MGITWHEFLPATARARASPSDELMRIYDTPARRHWMATQIRSLLLTGADAMPWNTLPWQGASPPCFPDPPPKSRAPFPCARPHGGAHRSDLWKPGGFWGSSSRGPLQKQGARDTPQGTPEWAPGKIVGHSDPRMRRFFIDRRRGESWPNWRCGKASGQGENMPHRLSEAGSVSLAYHVGLRHRLIRRLRSKQCGMAMTRRKETGEGEAGESRQGGGFDSGADCD